MAAGPGARPAHRLPSFVRLLALLIAWRVVIGPLWDPAWAELVALLRALARRLDGRLLLARPLHGRRWTITPRATPAPSAAALRTSTCDEPELTTRAAGVPLELQADLGAIRAHLHSARLGARHSMQFELGPLVKLQTEAVEGGGEVAWDEAFRVSLAASATALRSWCLAISCVEHTPAGSRLVGRASISLWACATGPRSHDHELRSPADDRAPVGRVAFRLTFGEHRAWAVSIERLRFEIPLDSIALDQLLGAGQEPGTAAAAGGTSWLRARRQLALDHRKRCTRLTYRLSLKQLVADTLFVSPVAKELRLEAAGASAAAAATAAAAAAARAAQSQPALAGRAESDAGEASMRARRLSWDGSRGGAAGSAPFTAANPPLGISERTHTGPPAYGGGGAREAGKSRTAAADAGGAHDGGAGKQPGSSASSSSPPPPPALPVPPPKPPAVFTRASSSSVAACLASPGAAIGTGLSAAVGGGGGGGGGVGPGSGGGSGGGAVGGAPPAGGAYGDADGPGAFGDAGADAHGGGDDWATVVEWDASELPPIVSFGYFEELMYGTVRLQLTADSGDAAETRAAADGGGGGCGGGSGGSCARSRAASGACSTCKSAAAALAQGGACAPDDARVCTACGAAAALSPLACAQAAPLSPATLPVDLSMEQRFKTGRQSALAWLRLEQLYLRSTPVRSRGAACTACAACAACVACVADCAADDGGGVCVGASRGTSDASGAEGGSEASGAGGGGGGGGGASVSAAGGSGGDADADADGSHDLVASFREFVWVKGVRAGRVTGTVRFESPPLFSQLLTGTLSEGGVVRQVCTVIVPRTAERNPGLDADVGGGSGGGGGGGGGVLSGPSSAFSSFWASLVSPGDPGVESSSEPHELHVLTERLLAQISAGAAGCADGRVSSTFDQVDRLLQSSHKETLVSFVYSSASRLHDTQALLLSFALRLLDAVPVTRFSLRARCYCTLQLLLRRGELNQLVLDQLGPGGPGLPTEIIRLLTTLLYRLLATALNGLHHGDMLEEQPSFRAAVIGICYFRVPRFADPLIEALAEPAAADRDALPGAALGAPTPSPPPTAAGALDVRSAGSVAIPEWRGLVFDLENDDTLSARVRPSEALRSHSDGSLDDAAHRPAGAPRSLSIASLFDWSPLHEAAERTLGAAELAQLRALVPPVAAWRSRLRAAGTPLFCSIFEQWVHEVASSARDMDEAQWHTVPGYKPLLKRFLLELKAQHVMHYPEAMLRLALVLLQHTHLHSVLTRIVLLKTNLHDVGGVSAALDLVGVWVGTLKHVNMPMIRSAFDFEFLFDAIRVLLEGEQMQLLLKTIEFLYTGFDLLLEEQADVLRRVVRPFFLKLFCHWSPNVRRFFHHLLIFRLVRPIGWTRVVEQLPTYRVLPAVASTTAAPGAAPAAQSPLPARTHASPTDFRRAVPASPRPGAMIARFPRGSTGDLTGVGAALPPNGGAGAHLASSSSFDSDGGDVVTWYEQAVDDMRQRRLSRVPHELRAYVEPSVRALDALCEQHAAVLRMAVSSGEPLIIPTLHWDTLLLDNEAY